MPAAQFGRVEMLAARQQAAAGADLQPVGVELRLRLAERGGDRQQLLRRKGVGDGHRRARWVAVAAMWRGFPHTPLKAGPAPAPPVRYFPRHYGPPPPIPEALGA